MTYILVYDIADSCCGFYDRLLDKRLEIKRTNNIVNITLVLITTAKSRLADTKSV